MTKKDFIALADAFRYTKPDTEPELKQWQRDIEALAVTCHNHHPRFKRDRWIAYINGECGPNGGKVKAA